MYTIWLNRRWRRLRGFPEVLPCPPALDPRRLTLPEVSVGHACTVKYLDSTAGGSGSSRHLATIRGEGTDTIPNAV